MSREDQDRQVAKQSQEQIAYNLAAAPRFILEVQVRTIINGEPAMDWCAVHPTNRMPYEWHSEDEARSAGQLCYGIDAEWRVTKL